MVGWLAGYLGDWLPGRDGLQPAAYAAAKKASSLRVLESLSKIVEGVHVFAPGSGLF